MFYQTLYTYVCILYIQNYQEMISKYKLSNKNNLYII
jgi:hypothetical protein